MPESDAVSDERCCDARIRLFGSRQALAEATNSMMPTYFLVSENDIGNLERGAASWPREPRRSVFRKALQAVTDQQVGYFGRRRHSMVDVDTPTWPSPGKQDRATADEPHPALLGTMAGGAHQLAPAVRRGPRLHQGPLSGSRCVAATAMVVAGAHHDAMTWRDSTATARWMTARNGRPLTTPYPNIGL
jgi:hypothetical protein